mmetsp:Transcript_69533/g.163416  ORF Transcript_69533/g.163416 Transcript_69533/m.163416 type:complete len:112 (+) Transcript_69533:224-559(+)
MQKKEESGYDFEQHAEYIIPHKHEPNRLYCTLTQMTLQRKPGVLHAHTNGRRFLAAKLRAEQAKAAQGGSEEEPDVVDEEEEEEDDDDSFTEQRARAIMQFLVMSRGFSAV